MATHQLAKGLASLGRNGDTMLMHVNPIEVEGLKALGAATGRKVTTNPDTGLPEAFDFLDFFTSLIPTGIGMLLAPGTGGASLIASKLGQTAATAAPVIGGMAAGAAVAGAKGDDPLMGGLMGGLGGYGGSNLGKTFMDMGKNTALQAAGPTTATGLNAEQIQSALQVPANEAANIAKFGPLTEDMGSTLANVKTFGPLTEGVAPAGGLSDMYSGMKTLAKDPFGAGYEAFKTAGGSAFDLAAPIGMAGLAGAQEDLYPEPDNSLEEKRKAEENKYKDPITGRLNLFQASPGLKLATGGTVGSNQSTISSGGIQDLYGSNDKTIGASGTTSLSQDGYGIGRLNALAAEGSRAKAADTFYAEGGPIAFSNGGMTSLLYRLFPELLAKIQLQSAMANSSTSSTPSIPSTIDPINEPGMFPQAANDYMASTPTDKGTFALKAKGGYLDGHGDGMSDSIPATIEGKQPARLADGEFVIPADVVSHIGNGSSKAGSKRLYAMLDRVRKARVGTTKQGKEIKPEKYMPA